MTSNNPMEPGAGLPAEPSVPSSEELGLENRVHDFPNTDLDQAVERGLVDTEPPHTVAHLPEAQDAGEPIESTDEAKNVSRRNFIIGGLLVGGGAALAVVGMKVFGSKDSPKAVGSDPKTSGKNSQPGTTTAPSTTPSTSPPQTTTSEGPVATAEKLPLLQLPISDDPLEIGHQLYANHAAWLNTNDARYGDYTYTDSSNIDRVKAAVGSAAEAFQQYRNTHPDGVHVEYDITLLNNSTFSPVNVIRSVTYDVIETQKDEGGNVLQSFHYIDSLALKKISIPTSPGSSQTVEGWLIDGQTEDNV